MPPCCSLSVAKSLSLTTELTCCRLVPPQDRFALCSNISLGALRANFICADGNDWVAHMAAASWWMILKSLPWTSWERLCFMYSLWILFSTKFFAALETTFLVVSYPGPSGEGGGGWGWRYEATFVDAPESAAKTSCAMVLGQNFVPSSKIH